MNTQKTPWIWLVCLLLVAAWIGARGLNADSLWFDEYWSIYNAGGAQYGPLSPAEVWVRVAAQDPWQAPGYFLLLSGWGALAGWTPFALRALSLLSGLLAVAWAYRLGRDLVSPFGGLGAVVTMGLSAYFLYYFHEMRTYTLIVMLIAMTGWAYWRVTHGGGRGGQLALFGGALCLLYTHYFAALTLGILALYHLLFVPKNRAWMKPALLMGAAGILFLPWLGVLLSGLNAAVEDTLRQANAWTPRQAVTGVLFMFSNGAALLAVVVGAYGLLPLLSHKHALFKAVAPKYVFLSDSRRKVPLFAWFWLVGMLAALLAVNARFGVILEVRYLFPLWPPLALVAALGIDRLSRIGTRGLAILILGLWGAAGVWNSIDSEAQNTLRNPHWYQPWSALVDALRPRVQPDDSLVYLLPDWTWPGYHQQVFDHYLHGVPVKSALLQRPENVGMETFVQEEVDAIGGANRVWLGYTSDQPTDYLDMARGILGKQGYMNCGSENATYPLSLELYLHGDLSTDTVDFEVAVLEFLELQYIPDVIAPNVDSLEVSAIWSHEADAPADLYSVGLHVENADGQLAAQADYGMPLDTRACHASGILLYDLPPGAYRLYVAVYNWQTGEPVMAGGVDRVLAGQFVIP